MVQVSSLVKKDLPLNLGDMMVGTDVVDPTKPVKNFTIQELNDFFFNGWQFEERSFVLDSSTPIYSGISPNVNLNPHLVPNSPPGQFIVIDPRFSVWKTVHEPNNPLIDVSGQVPYLFIGQYRDATYSVLTSNSALQAGNFPGGVSTFPDIGIGTPATPTQSKNTICKLPTIKKKII